MKFPCGVRAGTGRGPQRGSRAGVLESTLLTREVAGVEFLVSMMKGRRWEAGLAVALLFAVLMNSQLLIPNPLMPREVRMVHLQETASSNFLFGWLIVWLIRDCTTLLLPRCHDNKLPQFHLWEGQTQMRKFYRPLVFVLWILGLVAMVVAVVWRLVPHGHINLNAAMEQCAGCSQPSSTWERLLRELSNKPRLSEYWWLDAFALIVIALLLPALQYIGRRSNSTNIYRSRG